MFKDRNCNSQDFVFIDSMIWFDLAKGKLSIEKFKEWLTSKSLMPILHGNQLAELFHSKKTDDFPVLWNIIRDYGFSNFHPFQIFYEELKFVYLYGSIPKIEMLKDAVYQPDHKRLNQWKKEYFTNAHVLREMKKTWTEKELFIKGSTHFCHNSQSVKIREVISKINPNDTTVTSKVASGISEHITRHIKKNDRDIFDSEIITDTVMAGRTSYEDAIFGINELYNIGFSWNEILDMNVRELGDRVEFITLIRSSFDTLNLPLSHWEDFLEELRNKPYSAFFGYNSFKKITEEIRISLAKTKQSDVIDFVNLAYLPYCKCYVSDAHVIDTIRQCMPNQDTEIISAKDLMKILAH